MSVDIASVTLFCNKRILNSEILRSRHRYLVLSKFESTVPGYYWLVFLKQVFILCIYKVKIFQQIIYITCKTLKLNTLSISTKIAENRYIDFFSSQNNEIMSVKTKMSMAMCHRLYQSYSFDFLYQYFCINIQKY